MWTVSDSPSVYDSTLLTLHLIVGSLSTLHGSRAIAHAVLVHELHLVPGVLGQLLHIVEDLHLTVERQQRVIEVGNAGNDVALHHRLIVLGGDELHLCRTLHAEQVAEKIDIPAGGDGQCIGLGGSSSVERRQCSLRIDTYRRQEGELRYLQRFGHHVHVESGIQQVGVVVESLLDERLQLRVGKDRTPMHIAKRRSIRHGERIRQ